MVASVKELWCRRGEQLPTFLDALHSMPSGKQVDQVDLFFFRRREIKLKLHQS